MAEAYTCKMIVAEIAKKNITSNNSKKKANGFEVSILRI